MNQEPLQMESCEPPAALNVLLWPVVSPKNRVGGSPVFSFVFAFQNIGAILATPDENGGCGYDFASGVHKYLYGADDPVDYDDPSGNDYGSFDINMGTIFLPIAGLVTVPGSASLGAFGGTAGPDITIMLMHTLQDVRETFKHQPLSVREHAASNLCTPEIANGWEIKELNDLDYGNETVGEFGPTASYGTGLGSGTVQFGFPPKVYSAGAVDYALWGAMYELADETFFSSSPPISNPLAGSAVGDTFSEINANITARSFKILFHGDFDSYKAREASAFVSFGYTYGLSHYNPSGAAMPLTGDYGNVSSTPNGRFKWQWLGIPGHDTAN